MALKDWADGELLTPATMNELTSSMNMRFSSAAARDALLVGSLAPVAGMTVFMLDTNMALTYVVVGGNGYWAPQPYTLCFFARQAAAQGLGANTYAAITGYTVADYGGRNFGNWFDVTTGKFTPKVPGVYELLGGMSMANGPSGSTYAQRAGFRMNGTGAAAFSLYSENRQAISSDVPVSFDVRQFLLAMNGTTDYVELVANAANVTNTSTGAQAPVFGAKYMGQ